MLGGQGRERPRQGLVTMVETPQPENSPRREAEGLEIPSFPLFSLLPSLLQIFTEPLRHSKSVDEALR